MTGVQTCALPIPFGRTTTRASPFGRARELLGRGGRGRAKSRMIASTGTTSGQSGMKGSRSGQRLRLRAEDWKAVDGWTCFRMCRFLEGDEDLGPDRQTPRPSKRVRPRHPTRPPRRGRGRSSLRALGRSRLAQGWLGRSGGYRWECRTCWKEDRRRPSRPRLDGRTASVAAHLAQMAKSDPGCLEADVGSERTEVERLEEEAGEVATPAEED